LITYQERLYDDIKGDPSLSSLPVIGPSIVHGDQQELGDISDFLDFGNIHSYPEANPPEYRMGLNVERAEFNSATKPIMATETGYTNALNYTPPGPGENKPISEAGAGVYMPRLYFEYFIRHIARTFSYELLDEHPEPELEDREMHFGLLRNDLTPKPAFTALRNTIAILEDPGPAFTPGSLPYSLLDEGTAKLHSTLLQKRNGVFYLALWRLQSVWDPDEKQALQATPEPVTVQFGPGIESYAVYKPTLSDEPLASSSQPTESVSILVGPEVSILELRPVSLPQPILYAALTAPPAQEEATPESHCIVPQLRGSKLRAARKKLRAANCAIGAIAIRGGATARTGRVVRQRPKPGRALEVGAKVALALH
jgi:hypothetical protein